jgi:DNA replication and repair protein RecF
MQIKTLKLTNYRNHKKFAAEFDEQITVIMGANAVGKTNLLESIYMLSSTRSFKAKYDRDVINHREDFARIEGTISNGEEDKELEIFIQKNQNFKNASIKKAKINKVTKSLQKFVGTLKAVLFSPEDIEILMGSPSSRRKYMDLVLYQINPQYKKTHSEYIQAVRQRNKLLEKISETGRGMDELGFWNTKIVQNGISIQYHREKMIDYLKKGVLSYGVDLNNTGTKINIKYLKSEINFERLHEYQAKEIASRNTLIGPHRDDIEIQLNDFNVAEFGSRGQQRSAILALKLAETDYFETETGKRPILLLDDVFSEFDEKHKEAVTNTINRQQTIVTTTQKTKELPSTARLITLE